MLHLSCTKEGDLQGPLRAPIHWLLARIGINPTDAIPGPNSPYMVSTCSELQCVCVRERESEELKAGEAKTCILYVYITLSLSAAALSLSLTAVTCTCRLVQNMYDSSYSRLPASIHGRSWRDAVGESPERESVCVSE